MRKESGLWQSLRNLRCRLAGQLMSTTNTTNESGIGLDLVHGSQHVQAHDNHGTTSGAINAGLVSNEHGIDAVKDEDGAGQSRKNFVSAGLAKKLMASFAVLSALVVNPVAGLMSMLQGAPDFVEVACSPTSRLSSLIEEKGYMAKRINFKGGYDLESPKGTSLFRLEMKMATPRSAWVSLPCTRLSALQNLTPRSPEEWAKFEKRQQRDLKRADEVATAIEEAMDSREEFDFAWEWPTTAKTGWESRAIKRLLRKIREKNKVPYWCRFDGCAYGLTFNETPVKKSWTVLTTNRKLWLSLQKKCPGHTDHVHCRGMVAQSSSYYPEAMARAVVNSLIDSWVSFEDHQSMSLGYDIEDYLLEVPIEVRERQTEEVSEVRLVRNEAPDLFALSRTNYPKEKPTGKKLDAIKQQMMRIHRAAGHPSFGNLARLLRARQAPDWAITMAGSLECPDCMESRRPHPHPPAGDREQPALWEILGTDVFEFEHEDLKYKFVLWLDRASGLAFVDHLQTYKGNWEPPSKDLIRSFVRWLHVNPAPVWIISDSGRQYTSEEFMEFCGRSGIGLMTAPAEAHWIMGNEESTINILKGATRKLMVEEPALRVEHAMVLAAHGHNSTIGPHGFSPFQWTRGPSPTVELVLPGLDPKLAFKGLLELKEKARVSYEIEHAKVRLSKLNNAVGRPATTFTPGALVMLWRQKMKPGKAVGHWQGPVRVLLQEGSTVWTASGSTLVRAKVNQCRLCSKREELSATLEGAAIYKHPVTMDTLMKSFTGRYYKNITGETPSKRQLEDDVTAAEVQIAPRTPKVRQVQRERKRKGDEKDVPVPETPKQVKTKLEKVPEEPRDEKKSTEVAEESAKVEKTDEKFEEQSAVEGTAIPPGTVQSDVPNEDSDSGSSSSEELAMTPRGKKSKSARPPPPAEDSFYAFEFELEKEDQDYLLRHPRKAAIWLSKKMKEKGKEDRWSELSLERKKEYDVAQAKELSNVLQSKALRALTAQEWCKLDGRKAMQMRWVLTTKQDGSAKARLVVLGFQAHNLTEVQASAPTMSRISRNMMLAMCANKKFRIRAGDVTSAFLQASQSLEDEDLIVWAPAELAVLFGAQPSNPIMPLKVCKAFYGLVHAPRKWFEHVRATLFSHGWEALVSDPCVFLLRDSATAEVIGLAGLHVDDFLLGGQEGHPEFEEARRQLNDAYRWGKWEMDSFTFAGCQMVQKADYSIRIDQNDYTDKYLEEISIEPERQKFPKALATASEITQLRGLIGSLAWRSSQSSPQYQADVGLLLSEVPYATVSTLEKANKLVREVKRVRQSLLFPSWGKPWQELAVVVWADASNSNRPDKSSTMGIVAGVAPATILNGEEEAVALLSWKSSKTPRQCLGSNGAEVQAITEGEDACFRLRALLAEMNGEKVTRKGLYSMVASKTQGALVMDSRGIFDAMTKNSSALHGLRSGRAGYELTLAVSQALQIQTALRWVNGLAQLADCLTKGGAAKNMMLRFFTEGQLWRLIHDDKFVAGKKLKKLELEKQLKADQDAFVQAIEEMAKKQRWPWQGAVLRSLGDEITRSMEDPLPFERFLEDT